MNLYNSNQSLKEMLELTKDIIKQLKLAIESCKSKKDLSQSSIHKECLKNQIDVDDIVYMSSEISTKTCARRPSPLPLTQRKLLFDFCCLLIISKEIQHKTTFKTKFLIKTIIINCFVHGVLSHSPEVLP